MSIFGGKRDDKKDEDRVRRRLRGYIGGEAMTDDSTESPVDRRDPLDLTREVPAEPAAAMAEMESLDETTESPVEMVEEEQGEEVIAPAVAEAPEAEPMEEEPSPEPVPEPAEEPAASEEPATLEGEVVEGPFSLDDPILTIGDLAGPEEMDLAVLAGDPRDQRSFVTIDDLADALRGNQDEHNDIEIYDTKMRFGDKGQLEYMVFKVGIRESGEDDWTVFYKAVRLARLLRIPQRFREDRQLLEVWKDCLVGLHQGQVNFINIMANILQPTPIGLLFCYGVQATGETEEEAIRSASNVFEALMGSVRGAFPQIKFQLLSRPEAEWIDRQFREMKHLQMVRGIPVPRNSSGESTQTSVMSAQVDATFDEMNEEFLRGMSDREYLALIVTSPVSLNDINRWLSITATEVSKWKSEIQGTKAVTAGVSLPILFGGQLGSSVGHTLGNTHTLTHGTGETTTQGMGITHTTGVSDGQSQSLSVGHSVSDTVTHTASLTQTQSQTQGFTHTVGQSQGTAHSVTDTTGTSTGHTHTDTSGTSQGITHGVTTGQSHTESAGTSNSVSSGTSSSTAQSQTQSFGQSSSTGSTTGSTQTATSSTSSGQSQSFGSSLTQGQSQSTGTSSSIGATHTDGTSASQSQSASTSAGQTSTVSHTAGSSQTTGASNGTSSSTVVGQSQTNGYSSTVGLSQGQQTSTSTSQSQSLGSNFSSSTGTSTGHGVTDSTSATTSNSQSSTSTTSTGSSHGDTFGQSLSNSQSAGTTQTSSESQSQTQTQTLSQSFGDSAGISSGTSQGGSVSFGGNASLNASSEGGWNLGPSAEISAGGSGGVNASVSVNVDQINSSANVGNSQSLSVGMHTGASVSDGATSGVSHSQGTTQGQSSSFSDTNTSSQSLGQSLGSTVSHGSSSASSTTDSTSQSQSVGGSMSQSSGTSTSVGQSQSVTQSAGQTHTSATSENYGTSATSSTSQSVGTTNSTGTSQGQSFTQSQGTGSSVGTSTSDSSSVTNGTSASQGTSTAASQSNTLGFTSSSGQSVASGTSASQSLTQGTSTSSGFGSTSSLGSTQGLTTGQSQTVSNGLTQSTANSTNESWSQSQSNAVSDTTSQSHAVGQTLSQTQSVSNAQSTSSGLSVAKGQSVAQGQGVSNSTTESQGVTRTNTTSDAVSQQNSKAASTQDSSANGVSTSLAAASTQGWGSSMAIGPSFGVSKSAQWHDVDKAQLVLLQEAQVDRLMKGLREGAFYVDFYVLTPDEETKKTAQGLIKQAFWGNVFPQPVQVVEPDPVEARHLLGHAMVFSSCTKPESLDIMDGYEWSTILLPSELCGYCHPTRAEIGGVQTIVEAIPFFRVPGLMEGDGYMGHVVSPETADITGFEYRFSRETLRHTMIAGSSGTGKTVTGLRFVSESVNQLGCSATILDWKKDWRSLLYTIPEEKFEFYSLGVTRVNELRFNPLRVPEGVDPEMWAGRVAEAFVLAFGLGPRGYEILSRNLTGLYIDNRVLEDPKNADRLTMYDWYRRIDGEINEMRNNKSGSFGDTEAFNRVLKRMELFTTRGSRLFRMYGNPQDPLGVEDLARPNKVVVLEGHGMQGPTKSFIIGVIGAGIFEYARARERFSPEHLLVFEEAHEVVKGADTAGKDSSASSVTEESFFETAWNEGRDAGLVLVSVCQMPTHLPTSVLANTRSYFLHQMGSSEDIDEMARRIVRDPRYQHKDVPRWFEREPTGWCVVQRRNVSDYGDAEPVLINVEMIDAPRPSDDVLRDMMERKQSESGTVVA